MVILYGFITNEKGGKIKMLSKMRIVLTVILLIVLVSTGAVYSQNNEISEEYVTKLLDKYEAFCKNPPREYAMSSNPSYIRKSSIMQEIVSTKMAILP